MTNKLNTEKLYKVNYSIYGGEITIEDFNTATPNKKRINNQIETIDLLNQRKEIQKLFKHMTLEDLKEIKLVSNTNGRPSHTLTDEKWQTEFKIRKMFITPHSKKMKFLKGRHSTESGKWSESVTYHGMTNWQEYCSFINDILRNIRSGQVDYCYFIYQIMELARFHDNLRTKYINGYWEIWLEG